MMNLEQPLRVWRLATATRPALSVCAEPAIRAGRWHDVGDQVLYAYESEELAALSLSQLTHGVEPEHLVHETFTLPADASLHGEFDLAGEGRSRRNFFTPGVVRMPIVNLASLMRERKLLTLWVSSPYTTLQRTVLINARHAAFSDIRIESHSPAGSSFFSTPRYNLAAGAAPCF